MGTAKTFDRQLWSDEYNQVRLMELMRDIDEMVESLREFYPEHTWTRAEIFQLYYFDLMDNKLYFIRQSLRDEED